MLIHPGAEPQNDDEKAVVGFLDDWGPGAWPHMLDCYDRWLTDDFLWENTGSPPTYGKAAAMEFLSKLHDTLEMEWCTAELRNLASRKAANGDGIVLTERVDRIFLADGTEAIAIPIMGCFTVRDGKIARYADYNADSPIKERFPRHRH
ncbi:limonene-1,2-epoxide hydrolase family protein [Sporichthya polymorpha]|uniref:limonene-1,2-epoxide hydrolase family protein n=1 Tax=Sporichthya polymorpha TaxID=35751 RepID=UPI00037E8D90|nr:limonene-1,2-epoxide hydrolase family protein [Sporichthya polymorpha]